jgi:hypothetical protein
MVDVRQLGPRIAKTFTSVAASRAEDLQLDDRQGVLAKRADFSSARVTSSRSLNLGYRAVRFLGMQARKYRVLCVEPENMPIGCQMLVGWQRERPV